MESSQPMPAETRPTLLLVDDHPENLAALERTLRSNYTTVCASSGEQAIELLRKQSFSVVLCDQRMPDRSGVEVLEQALKLQPNCTRMVQTGYSDPEEILKAVNRCQIFRYLTKPWNPADIVHAVAQAVEAHNLRAEREKLIADLMRKEKELSQLNRNLEKLVEERTIELKKANDRLNDLAMTDPLTKLLNRRALGPKIAEEVERAKRYSLPLIVGMADVDHFKSFNDMEGHLYGDEALRKIASIFTSNLRKTDVICRYGGEEFLIVMPQTAVAHARETCNRLRAAVETTGFRGQSNDAYLTISIGLASFPIHGKDPESLIQSADNALYEAKRLGRNRIVFHE